MAKRLAVFHFSSSKPKFVLFHSLLLSSIKKRYGFSPFNTPCEVKSIGNGFVRYNEEIDRHIVISPRPNFIRTEANGDPAGDLRRQLKVHRLPVRQKTLRVDVRTCRAGALRRGTVATLRRTTTAEVNHSRLKN